MVNSESVDDMIVQVFSTSAVFHNKARAKAVLCDGIFSK